ncbi:MAG TPA: arsinothricin resistance N-acetyltransferase ArsN1 family B [Vicinamibacterales bacterium]|nr:arsinothricin resistance N-acetyltransferase ArsN1 family B [Vicinamibacterales bacterium]
MIRTAALADAARVAGIYHPYVADTPISFEVSPPAEAEMRERMRVVLERLPWLVHELDGEVAGYAYAAPHRTREAYQWSVDVAVYVHQDFHRRGIGRELYLTLFAKLIRQGYVNAYAGITLPNEKSVGLHESLGFTPVGVYRNVGYKQGAWLDVGWWHLQLQPLPSVPAPPLAPDTVVED